MVNSAKLERWKRPLAPAVAGASLLWAFLINLLYSSDYPVNRPEVMMLLVLIGVFAVVMAWFYQQLPQWGRAFLEGSLVALAVDMAAAGSLWYASAAGFGIFLFTGLRKTSVMAPAAIMSSIVLLTTVLGLGEAKASTEARSGVEGPSTSSPEMPAMLHIILDEHAGPAGLPDESRTAAKLREEMNAFYSSRGFAVFDRAYSEYLHTVHAVPHILNYGQRTGAHYDKAGVRTGQTTHLRSLEDKGYRLHLYQSDFADLCSGTRYARCTTYSYTSLRPTLDVPMTTVERAGLLITRFAAESTLAEYADAVWRAATYRRGLAHPLGLAQRARTSTIASLMAMDLLIEDLKAAKPGEAYVGHFLVPHFPYVVDESCAFIPLAQWESRISLSPRPIQEARYFDQVRCTMRKMDAALAAMEKSPAGRNFIVVVHGDHGSKISPVEPLVENRQLIEDQDLVAAFSTLFAVKAPGIDPGSRTHVASAACLLGDVSRRNFRSSPESCPSSGEPRSVVLATGDWQPRSRTALPADW